MQCLHLIERLQLPATYMDLVQRIYVPLVAMLKQKKSGSPLFVSISGAQGAGKTTLVAFLKLLLESEHQLSTLALSLDDFYLGRQQRERLAKRIHPLFITRGVPGTHHLKKLEEVIKALLSGHACLIPTFNKATDDQFPESNWFSCQQRADIILFEGWCNNCPVMTSEQLSEPVNELEATEDKQAVWRTYSNEQLLQYHQHIYSRTDVLLMLKAPDFEQVFAWRRQQEDKLRLQTPARESSHIMDNAQLERFIMHFERNTRHSLEYLPENADIVLPLTSTHDISRIIQRQLPDIKC